MEYDHLEERIVQQYNKKEVQEIKDFLNRQGLQLEADVEYTMALLDREKIIATGSFAGRVLKCIAVDPAFQGMGISNRVVSHLANEEYRRGNTHLFVYTKPINQRMFEDLGFYVIAAVPSKVVLMENDPKGIFHYVKNIEKKKVEGEKISAIVVNCNPFTLGHQYIIERAAAQSDVLHVFVVWEDQSSFPSEIRYQLVKEGTKHLSNVVLHKGEDYIISAATFPSYFIKQYEEVVETHGALDLEIFCQYIAPALKINKRFVGKEPYCPVTNTYNCLMKQVLPRCGIEVEEIPRLVVNGIPVSASLVRKCIRSGEMSKIENLVPKTTYDFLLSGAAQPIIKKIQCNDSRH